MYFKNLSVKSLIIILLIAIILSAIFLIAPFYELFTDNTILDGKEGSGIISLYSATVIVLTYFLVVATAGIAYVAHIQLNNAREQLKQIGKSARGEFLIRLDERFTSPQIIEARTTVHIIYRNTQPDCKHNGSHKTKLCEGCTKIHMQLIRNQIQIIGRDSKKSKEFIQLRSLIELFETIGYFSRNGYVNVTDVNELIGGTVEFHYEIFKNWIDYLQVERSPHTFREFEWLAWKVNSSIVNESKIDALSKMPMVEAPPEKDSG